MSDTAALLDLKDIRKTYKVSQGLFSARKTLSALRQVSLTINKGDVLGIVGESGCGKSTLARILLSLERPSEGTITFEGRPLSGVRHAVISRRVQPIFQDPYSSLNPRKTIGSIITLPLRVHGIGTARTQREALVEMMDGVGLPERLADSYPSQLSGGQRQRVAIARALIMRPELVICDEPTSALDVSVQSQILNMLMDLKERFGLTYVFISHNLAVVEHIASRIAVMYLGRVVEQAEARAFFAEPKHPYSQALMASVLAPDPDLGIPDLHLGTVFPNPLDPPSGCAFHPRCPRKMDVCTHMQPVPFPTGDGYVECHLYGPAAAQATTE